MIMIMMLLLMTFLHQEKFDSPKQKAQKWQLENSGMTQIYTQTEYISI